MTTLYGWAGRVLRVNLSTGAITTEPTEAHTQIGPGGRGLGQWVLFREVSSNADPLGLENQLSFSAGPLVGTLAPTAARLSIDTKNPQTGGIATTNVGGHFGPELKYAGFDSIIVEGQARDPVILVIADGEAELRAAGALWGRTNWETENALKAELGDNRWRLASIGPAGENLVHGACVTVDRGRAAGR
ncbi:MAG: aldehyde ferredoxin oxidoreductase N-terminal domain-containing protein, partial [Anaerolineales bacterium]